MNLSLPVRYRYTSLPPAFPYSFRAQLNTMMASCKEEMASYSYCVMRDGIQTEEKGCQQEFDLLKQCIAKNK